MRHMGVLPSEMKGGRRHGSNSPSQIKTEDEVPANQYEWMVRKNPPIIYNLDAQAQASFSLNG